MALGEPWQGPTCQQIGMPSADEEEVSRPTPETDLQRLRTLLRLIPYVLLATLILLVGLVAAQVIANNRPTPAFHPFPAYGVVHGCPGNGPPPNDICSG